jgi:hypothetical protein
MGRVHDACKRLVLKYACAPRASQRPLANLKCVTRGRLQIRGARPLACCAPEVRSQRPPPESAPRVHDQRAPEVRAPACAPEVRSRRPLAHPRCAATGRLRTRGARPEAAPRDARPGRGWGARRGDMSRGGPRPARAPRLHDQRRLCPRGARARARTRGAQSRAACAPEAQYVI